MGNRDARYAPQGVYPVLGSDRWIAVSVQDDAAWRALCRLTGHDGEAGQGFAERHARHDELDQRLADWCAAQDGLALESRLQQAGVAAHRVLDTHDLYVDPQLLHRSHYLSVRHPKFETAMVESARLVFSRTRPRAPAVAPWFGCDNETVLRELLGYDAERYAALEEGGFLR